MKTIVIIIENLNNRIDINFLKEAIDSNIEYQHSCIMNDDRFMAWADLYFIKDNLNVKINKYELMNSYVLAVGRESSNSLQNFRKSLQNYCKLKGWVFNPAEQQRKNGLIIINTQDSDGRKMAIECFYFKA